MTLLLTSLAVWLSGALLALAAGRAAKAVSLLAPLVVLAGCVLAAAAAVQTLATGAVERWEHAWPVPLGSFVLELDALSALFLLPIAIVSGLAAVYGGEYLGPYRTRKNLGVAWFFYTLLTASMVLVVTARNGLLFLVAWEVMSLTSFFLVMFADDAAPDPAGQESGTARAGWTYLVASHLGTAFLLALFVVLGSGGTLDFSAVPSRAALGESRLQACLLLALLGFGTKAGFVPLHVWLPEAHPAAPSHVSAVMSGVMIKMGLYGLLRVGLLLGPLPVWWGWLLVALGAATGILGVLFALAQHDLKRLLAYSSVENMGLIALGLGLGLLGVSYGQPLMAALGFGGALLHVVNHALFKSLLFLGAGAVAHAAHTRTLDRLGGLLKRMPVTGATFLVGAAAISGLPPLNGFVSEWLLYCGGLQGLLAARTTLSAGIAGVAVLGSLALIGGLAAACFAKAFGIVFLGEPRTAPPPDAVPHEAGLAMRIPLIVLALGCALAGLLGPWLPTIVAPAVRQLLAAGPGEAAGDGLAWAQPSLIVVSGAGAGLLLLTGLLAWLRHRLLAGRTVAPAVTWDCGYAAPTPRMQYSASSFTDPLATVFRAVLGTRTTKAAPVGLFPDRAALETETPDRFRERLFAPLFRAIRGAALRLHGLQQGRIQLYVLYIAVALLVLLLWKLR